jgi:integrase
MKRQKRQLGHLYQRGGWWVMRYRVTVSRDGMLSRVQRAERIAPIAQYATEEAVRQTKLFQKKLTEATIETPAADTVMRLGEYASKVFLPAMAGQRKASTARDYRNRWKRYLAPHCGKLWMREVKTHHVSAILKAIAREHDINITSLSHCKWLLSAVFIDAKNQGYFDGENPVVDAILPNAKPKSETYAYSLDEVNRMLSFLPEPAATVVAVAAYTGLRKGEIQGLQWENYTGAELRVTRAIWNGIIDEPKTAASKKAVPVIPQLRGMLDAHRKACGDPATGPIFANGRLNPMDLHNLECRVILPILHRCKHCREDKDAHKKSDHRFELDCKMWHGFHAFRRGLGTTLYRLGVPDKTIQNVLRHAQLSTTMNLYVKAREEDSRNSMVGTLSTAVDVCADIVRQPEKMQSTLPN